MIMKNLNLTSVLFQSEQTCHIYIYIYIIYVQYVLKLWMEFVKFRQSSELNFSHLKKEIEGLNLKMDELKQLLVEVSNM